MYRVVYWLSLLRIFQVLNSTQPSMHLGNHAPVGRRPHCFQIQQFLTGSKPNYSAKRERRGAGGFSTRMLFMRFHFIRKQHQIVLTNNAKSQPKHPKFSSQNIYRVSYVHRKMKDGLAATLCSPVLTFAASHFSILSG